MNCHLNYVITRKKAILILIKVHVYIFISHCVALLVLHKLGEVIGLLGNLPVLYGKGLELFAYKYRRGTKHIYNGVTHLVTHIHL